MNVNGPCQHEFVPLPTKKKSWTPSHATGLVQLLVFLCRFITLLILTACSLIALCVFFICLLFLVCIVVPPPFRLSYSVRWALMRACFFVRVIMRHIYDMFISYKFLQQQPEQHARLTGLWASVISGDVSIDYMYIIYRTTRISNCLPQRPRLNSCTANHHIGAWFLPKNCIVLQTKSYINIFITYVCRSLVFRPADHMLEIIFLIVIECL